MNTPLGVGLSVGSSVLFGALYYLSTRLQPLTGTAIFGWRMPLTLPLVTVFMMAAGEWRHVRAIAARLRRHPALLPGLALSSGLIGVQQWLFLWAPTNGLGLSVSVGYFLLPLTLLIVGRVAYRDRLSRLQAVAAAVAAVGVAHEVARSGGVAWPTALVALGFPAYFAWRRKLGTDNLGGLWFDLLLMCPVAIAIVLTHGGVAAPLEAAPRLFALLPLLAVMSAAGFMGFILASRLLPLALFGLLTYVEPVLLFIVALVIGERVGWGDLMTYGPIMAAVAILAAEGLLRLWEGAHRRPGPA